MEATRNNFFADAAKRDSVVLGILNRAEEPMTLHDIYEKPEVKALSTGPHNVNDSLKRLRDKVAKVPTTKANYRYAYWPVEKLHRRPALTSSNKKVTVPSLRAVSKPMGEKDLQKELKLVKLFLNDQEYLAFLKGALLIMKDHEAYRKQIELEINVAE